jgi:hypothetical protein
VQAKSTDDISFAQKICGFFARSETKRSISPRGSRRGASVPPVVRLPNVTINYDSEINQLKTVAISAKYIKKASLLGSGELTHLQDNRQSIKQCAELPAGAT